jgi:lipopolysaccharide biosynthesis glycosyltransferase
VAGEFTRIGGPAETMTAPHITYVLDRGFVQPTLISAYSALKARPRDVTIRLFLTEPVPELEAPLARMRRAFPDAVIEAGHEAAMDHGFQTRGHVSAATLARLYLPKFLEPKTLYIDGDTLVLHDVGPVFGLDLGGKPIATVLDPGIQKALWYRKRGLRVGSRKSARHLRDLDKIADLVDPEAYFNAGVILFDLPRIRETGLDAAMMDVAGAVDLRKKHDLRFNDQNWLNVVFRGQSARLGAEWNTFWGNRLTNRAPFPAEARAAYSASRADPALVHFVGKTKPWTVRFPQLHPKRWPWIFRYKAIQAECEALIHG